MHPTIAITPCRSLPDYVESVRRGGGDPRPLDRATDRPVDVVDRSQGILLTGGPDLDPVRYGEAAHSTVTGVDPERDEYEIELVRRAIEADVPVLAICRGLQVMNVAFGGTLVQDIPSELPGASGHVVPAPLYGIAHDVWIVRASLLGSVMGDDLADGDTLPVNSRHHQAVRRLADGFEVSATAPDGIIEAVERPGARFCLAVQWHPENFWRTGEFRCLFEAFVDACSRDA